MSTTDILFNSPALHSLKRAQLVQLCKRHNIKATGKNPDIIDRLKKHALTLPPDAPLHLAVRSEAPRHRQGSDETDEDEASNDDENTFDFRKANRPSEMWEVVMDDIPEESGSLKGTLKSMGSMGSHGEFGSSGSINSMTSSLKAFASSLGLKRPHSENDDASSVSKISTNSKKSAIPRSPRKVFAPHNNKEVRDSLVANAVPYSSIPQPRPSALPHTDHFSFNPRDSLDAPLPGFPGREGTQAGTGATIKLVTKESGPAVPLPALMPLNHLSPEPSFSITPATPPVRSELRKYLMSPKGIAVDSPTEDIYPSLNFDQSRAPTRAETGDDEDVLMPGGLSPARIAILPSSSSAESNSPKQPLPLAPPSQAFVFGSPNPRHSTSNTDFHNAASSVLAEMNARLGLKPEQTINLDSLTGKKSGQGMSEEELLNYKFGGASKAKQPEVNERFQKAHEEQFKKMDSILTHYAVRTKESSDAPVIGKKRKSNALGTGSGPRRPSTLASQQNARRRSSTRVISSAAARRRMIPGGFGDDDDEELIDEERHAKKARVIDDNGEDSPRQKKVSIAPEKHEEEESKSAEELRKEREAIKLKLQHQRAKRRSTLGRPSMGKAPAVPAPKPKAVTSRFGFLSSAKSLVKSVWNRGAGASTTASSIPQPKAAPTVPSSAVAKVDKEDSFKKPALPKTAPLKLAKKPSLAESRRSTSGQSLNANKPTGASLMPPVPSTSRSRSPIPPFVAGGSVKSTSTTNTNKSRGNSSIGIAGQSVKSTGQGSLNGNVHANVSSMGTRNSVASLGPSRISSMGSKTSSTRVSVASRGSIETRGKFRPSSTLYAPTASSLAKMQQTVKPPMTANGSTSSRRAPSTSIRDLKPTPEAIEPEPEPQSRVIVPMADVQPLRIVSRSTPSPSKIPVNVNSPRPGRIFTQPLILPMSPKAGSGSSDVVVNPITGITSPVRTKAETYPTAGPTELNDSKADAGVPKEAVKRQISVQRRPRISRSKVIAKLGAKRAAAATGGASSSSRMAPSAKTRSSVGAAIAVSSTGLAIGRRSHGARLSSKRDSRGMVMNAKKRVRMSEYARRRSSRMMDAARNAMDVDDEDDE